MKQISYKVKNHVKGWQGRIAFKICFCTREKIYKVRIYFYNKLKNFPDL
jgi:hypothetical protein